ncbi:MAG: hypothetical protein R2762_17105 [Bryobacteraceae bacterium]
MINVVDEKVQRPDPLLQAAFERAPFRACDDARNQVKWKNTVPSSAFPVDVERNSHLEQHALGHLLASAQLTFGKRFNRVHQSSGRRPGRPVSLEHLIMKWTGIVVLEDHTGNSVLERKQSELSGSAGRGPRWRRVQMAAGTGIPC